MWIHCLAEDSLETSSYFLWKTMKKYLSMSSAAVMFGALRVNESQDNSEESHSELHFVWSGLCRYNIM